MTDILESWMDEDGTLHLSVWIRRGKLVIRRDALDLSDPEHPVNLIEAMGGNPAQYGYRDAMVARRKELEARELIGEYASSKEQR